jgi:hypothetical protein
MSAYGESIDRIWLVSWHLLYLFIYQGLNSGFQWSIYSGVGWSGELAFPLCGCVAKCFLFSDHRLETSFRRFPENKKPDDLSSGFASLAVRTGLEPATHGVTGRYSNQLNYRTSFSIEMQN